MSSDVGLLLHARALRVCRAQQWCAPAIDLSLYTGNQLFIEGANGSGKSTLLRSLAGIYEDFEGDYTCYARVIYISHRCGYKESLTLEHNLRWYCALWDAPQDKIRTCLNELELVDLVARPLGQMSAGQRQRATLSRLPLSQTSIWLLDEPESSLDKMGRQLLERLISKHLRAGGGVIRSSATAGDLRVRAVSSETPSMNATGFISKPGTLDLLHATDEKSVLAPILKGIASMRVLCKRDIYLLWYEHRVWRMPLLLALVACLPALVLVTDANSLREIAPVLFWSLALLTMFSGGDELCARDREDDILAQMCLAPIPLWQLVLARIVAMSLTLALPIALVALPIALLLGLSTFTALSLMAGFAVGAPALASFSVLSGALVAPLGGRATLGAMISLPLALPVLLFGIIAAEAATQGLSPMPGLALLGAFSLGALMLLPMMIGMGWRVASSV